MENILFLILVAVIGLIRFIAQIAENKRNADAAKKATSAPADARPKAPVERAPAESEEERIRKFMEALGMPTTEAPRRPVQPTTVSRAPSPAGTPEPQQEPKRKAVPPLDPFPRPVFQRPVVVVQPSAPGPVAPVPPPLPAAPPPLRKREPSVVVEQSTRTAASVVPEFTVRDIDEAAAEAALAESDARRAAAALPASGRSGLVERLATHEGLRDAMVLREIFGPPRSLEPLERSFH
jgi:hypothetical protein